MWWVGQTFNFKLKGKTGLPRWFSFHPKSTVRLDKIGVGGVEGGDL